MKQEIAELAINSAKIAFDQEMNMLGASKPHSRRTLQAQIGDLDHIQKAIDDGLFDQEGAILEVSAALRQEFITEIMLGFVSALRSVAPVDLKIEFGYRAIADISKLLKHIQTLRERWDGAPFVMIVSPTMVAALNGTPVDQFRKSETMSIPSFFRPLGHLDGVLVLINQYAPDQEPILFCRECAFAPNYLDGFCLSDQICEDGIQEFQTDISFGGIDPANLSQIELTHSYFI